MIIFIRILFFFFMIMSAVSIGQTRKFEFRDLSKDSLLSIAKVIIESQKTCTFITVDQDNKPRARILANFPIEDDWVIWLGTSTNSRKVKQVEKNHEVIVFYYDSKGKSYVSISGSAQIINDAKLKKKYWKDSWKVYYPNPDKDYNLIKVKPYRMEICSYKHKLFWDADGKPAQIEF